MSTLLSVFQVISIISVERFFVVLIEKIHDDGWQVRLVRFDLHSSVGLLNRGTALIIFRNQKYRR